MSDGAIGIASGLACVAWIGFCYYNREPSVPSSSFKQDSKPNSSFLVEVARRAMRFLNCGEESFGILAVIWFFSIVLTAFIYEPLATLILWSGIGFYLSIVGIFLVLGLCGNVWEICAKQKTIGWRIFHAAVAFFCVGMLAVVSWFFYKIFFSWWAS